MRKLVQRFARDESGTTAIEYAIIAGGISVVIVAAVQTVGGKLTTIFTNVATLLAPAA